MTFDHALDCIRDGHRVRRRGWCAGVSATCMAVHLEPRDLLADDWEVFVDALDLAAIWEKQAAEPYRHPAAQATLRSCARELREQYPRGASL